MLQFLKDTLKIHEKNPHKIPDGKAAERLFKALNSQQSNLNTFHNRAVSSTIPTPFTHNSGAWVTSGSIERASLSIPNGSHSTFEGTNTFAPALLNPDSRSSTGSTLLGNEALENFSTTNTIASGTVFSPLNSRKRKLEGTSSSYSAQPYDDSHVSGLFTPQALENAGFSVSRITPNFTQQDLSGTYPGAISAFHTLTSTPIASFIPTAPSSMQITGMTEVGNNAFIDMSENAAAMAVHQLSSHPLPTGSYLQSMDEQMCEQPQLLAQPPKREKTYMGDTRMMHTLPFRWQFVSVEQYGNILKEWESKKTKSIEFPVEYDNLFPDNSPFNPSIAVPFTVRFRLAEINAIKRFLGKPRLKDEVFSPQNNPPWTDHRMMNNNTEAGWAEQVVYPS